MTIMGSSSSVVMTVSLLPKVNIVERFLRGARLEKKPGETLRQGVQLKYNHYVAKNTLMLYMNVFVK